MLLPYDGPGVPDDHDDAIICIIVRHKEQISSEASSSTSKKAKYEVNEEDDHAGVESPRKPVVEIPLDPA